MYVYRYMRDSDFISLASSEGMLVIHFFYFEKGGSKARARPNGRPNKLIRRGPTDNGEGGRNEHRCGREGWMSKANRQEGQEGHVSQELGR